MEMELENIEFNDEENQIVNTLLSKYQAYRPNFKKTNNQETPYVATVNDGGLCDFMNGYNRDCTSYIAYGQTIDDALNKAIALFKRNRASK